MSLVDEYLENNNIEELQKIIEKEKNLRDAFLRKYPVESIPYLSLEDYLYATKGYGNPNSFCRQLMRGLKTNSSLGNSRTNIFGVYQMEEQISLDDSLKKQFGDDIDKAFEYTKSQILSLLKAGAELDYTRISETDLNSAFKYKLLAVYYSDLYFPAPTRPALDAYCNIAGIVFDPKEELVYRNRALVEWKDTQPDLKDWSNIEVMRYLDWIWDNKTKIEDENGKPEPKYVAKTEKITQELAKTGKSYLIDGTKLEHALNLMKIKIGSKPEQNGLPVLFDNGFFQYAEGYKYKVFDDGREALKFDSWSPVDIGSGHILECVLKAFKKSYNLVYFATNVFKSRAQKELLNFEKAIYTLYIDPSANDQMLIKEISRIVGNDYNKLAYLLFLKNKDKYLPCKPEHFSVKFTILNIYTECLKGFTYEHYSEFIQIISDIRDKISDVWNVPVTLLDAHSFVWSIDLIEKELLNTDDDYRDYSEGTIDINTTLWCDLLKDEELFSKDNIDLLARFYCSPKHAKTCTDLGMEDGVSPSTFISPVANMGKRISNHLDLPPLYRENGERRYWQTLFLGKKLLDGHFAWKMRPELAEAFKQTFPEMVDEYDEKQDEIRASILSPDEILQEAKVRSTRNVIKKQVSTTAYQRDPFVAEHAKNRAQGVCLLCEATLDYKDSKGRPYLESHHIIPLEEGGPDSIDNIAALCPNCHRKMHTTNKKWNPDYENDKEFLIACVKSYCKQEGYEVN